jgi:hypothetical protein
MTMTTMMMTMIRTTMMTTIMMTMVMMLMTMMMTTMRLMKMLMTMMRMKMIMTTKSPQLHVRDVHVDTYMHDHTPSWKPQHVSDKQISCWHNSVHVQYHDNLGIRTYPDDLYRVVN